MSDPAGLAYALTAVVCAAVAMATWRRRAQNPVLAVLLTVVMAGGCWWSVGLAVTVVATDQATAAVAMIATFPGPSCMLAALVCFAFAVANPQWAPRRGAVVALLTEPVLIMLAAATNPWHLLVYGGAGAAALTAPAGWTYGPLYWLDSGYEYLEMAVAVALVARGWWKAPSAFRAQRLTLLLAALVPLAANAVFLAGGFGHILDPTPFGFTVTGIVMSYAISRQDLFTFSPVARALIVDQVGDAVVVIGTGGRFLDLNPAGIDLVRGVRPDAPANLVGVLADGLFGDLSAAGQTELVVDLAGGRAEFHVQASPLVDRRRRDLGRVYVARDVTEANALSRRLAAAHTQLVAQVETIEVLRADLVELAGRDPLTGLHNRRHLVARFAALLAAAEATGGLLAVAVFDLDEFKSVNDTHGHLAGDAVLIAFAALMTRCAPPDALVARWGGEEFFAALPGADAAAGLAYADDVRRHSEHGSVMVDALSIGCTVSGGVATYPASGATMDALFHAADGAVYEAKRSGRNAVRLHRASVTSPRGV